MKAFTVWDWIVTSSKSSQLPQTLVTYWSGIVPPERRSGWFSDFSNQICVWLGCTYLSAKNPAYNPISYQLGSVWPHDNSFIAAGLKRYGSANRVAEYLLPPATLRQDGCQNSLLN